MEQIELAAPTDGWVLINGENGTGKELVARQIHNRSLRRAAPFVELNCAAIPDEMIESELFGHEKGAFPGASSLKIGKFDQANGGTLFLDEIGDMSLKTQSKILRVLEEQRFERVGSVEIFEVDIRIIAASNKNLQEEIAAGNFREDLYYRLNVIPIDIPPLKERKKDIPLLIEHFLSLFVENGKSAKKKISKEALNSMMAYHWPGNVRELKNIVERMIIMVRTPTITLKHVPPVIRMANQELLQVDAFPTTFKEAKETFEKQFIQTMLLKNNWNISKTAENIQIERSNLHRKIKQLEIVVPK
jgi:two-component system nitrogen regulation response regulator NtrX